MAHAQALTRAQVCEALAAHFTAKLGGTVSARYVGTKRMYEIHGATLPGHVERGHTGYWTMLNYLSPTKAREIIARGLT